MRRSPLFLLAALLLALPLAGCDLAEEDFRPEVVVEGFLFANEFLPAIRLSETAPFSATYSFEEYALSGADVRIVLLDEAGGEELSVPFTEAPDVPGTYVPDTTDYLVYLVRPGRRYRFEARLPGRPDLVPPGEIVRAETTVPDSFRIATPPPDTVAYDVSGPGPAFDVTPSETPGRQAVFLFTVTALDPDTYGLTLTIASLIEDTDADPADFVNSSSPVLNEGNYDRNPDGTITIRVPWLAIAYFGPNRFTLHALDDAAYDFIRSRTAQFSPTTLSPGEIQDVLSNVENGTGVFGSFARVSTEIFVQE